MYISYVYIKLVIVLLSMQITYNAYMHTRRAATSFSADQLHYAAVSESTTRLSYR